MGFHLGPRPFPRLLLHTPHPSPLSLSKPVPWKRLSSAVSRSRPFPPAGAWRPAWALGSECRVAVLSPRASRGSGRELRAEPKNPTPPRPSPLAKAATLSPQGPRAATPPGAVWDMSAVVPQRPAAGQPRAGWPRGLKAGRRGRRPDGLPGPGVRAPRTPRPCPAAPDSSVQAGSGSAPARGGCDQEGAGLLGSAPPSGLLTLRRDVGLWLCDPKPAPPALWNLLSAVGQLSMKVSRFQALKSQCSLKGRTTHLETQRLGLLSKVVGKEEGEI